MTGQGGWPLNVFLTPEQVPFYAGTYFPPESRMGMPSWRRGARGGRRGLGRRARRDPRRRRPDRASGSRAARCSTPSTSRPATRRRSTPRSRRCAAHYDRANGGFGGAPKFPPASALEFLLRRGETEMTRTRCARWRRAACTTRSAAASPATRSTRTGWSPTSRRCSTTTRCSRAPTCTAGRSRATSCSGAVAEETLDWALREMRGPEGGFYSALDADSEGEEGKFYVWTRGRAARGARASRTPTRRSRWFGATERGNFEGANILTRAARASPSGSTIWRAALYEVRSQRVLAGPRRQAADLVERADDLRAGRRRRGARARRLPDAAARRAEFVLRELRDADGRLLRTYKDGAGEAERLPGGPRLPARGAAHALRGRRSSRAGSRRRARSRTR